MRFGKYTHDLFRKIRGNAPSLVFLWYFLLVFFVIASFVFIVYKYIVFYQITRSFNAEVANESYKPILDVNKIDFVIEKYNRL